MIKKIISYEAKKEIKMKKLIKKAIGCFVIFSFAISNIAQAAPPESALRPGSSRETPLPHELEGALSNPIEYDNIAPGARSILDELGPSDKAYFANLFSQFMNPAESRPLIIGGNFFPSAMLSDEEFEQKLGAAQYEDLLKDKRNTEAAKNVTLVHNPLNGGIGQAMKRLEFLRQIWDRTGRKGEVDWGAKSMDCYFKVSIIINGQEKEAFVSVAEATILALLHETELGLYKRAILQEFISGETRKAMKDLMDTDYLYDRVDDTKKQKRKYGDILRERGFLADFPEQALFPRFCVQDNNQLTDRQTAPGSHGQWGVYTLMQALDEELPEDGSTLIHTIYNGDGISNSPDNVITGWMARERIPIIMISTTRTGIDKKGGMIGIDYIDEERTALRKNLLELADAENNDKTHPGQTALFRDMGLTEGRKGQQLFNTNTVLTNTSVLKPLLIELKDILGIEELTRIIGPKLIKKSKRVTDDDDT